MNKNINKIKYLQNISVNPDWAKLPLFDRSTWQRIKFGDVVANVNDTERDPQGAGIERFIGLEHLEPGSLHIRSWGNVADGTTFSRRCRPGQVLFGKRRAYQRKVAVADFDAVVSGDIYVFAPKNDRLLPELLPFLCMSERFFKFAVETSAGSLSPRTNWSSIVNFEFDLPPLDQQCRIAEILWAENEVEQSHIQTTSATKDFLSATIESRFDELFRGTCDQLSNLWSKSPDSGCSAPPSSIETGHFVLSLTALSSTGYLRGNLKPVEPTNKMLGAKLSKGDFLISRSNTSELVGLVGIFDEEREDVSFPDTMMRMHVDEKRLLKSFLELVLISARGRKHMMRSAAGTSGSMKKINRQTLGQCMIPVPPISAQHRLLENVYSFRDTLRYSNQAIVAAKTLKNETMNTVFT